MKRALSRFQDSFVDTLYGAAPADPLVAEIAAQPGFAVYRNTVFKGCIDALEANFPAVARLVGSAWFRSAAAVYARQFPPDDARLVFYGAEFARFLDGFESARDLPYLGNVARLDWLWLEVYTAAGDAPLDTGTLAELEPSDLMRSTLMPRASVRWAWFDGQPARTIWNANREAIDMPADLAWTGEGTVLLPAGGGVTWRALGAGACALLDACACRTPLMDAMANALAVEPDADPASLLLDLFGAGVFGAISFPEPQAELQGA